ncbi:MAG: hypothetical protein ABI890_03350 [Lapillicoccus sp.]
MSGSPGPGGARNGLAGDGLAGDGLAGSGVADGVLRVVDEVLVRPVRRGRLRSTGWPAGLSTAVGLGVVAYLVAVGLVVFGGTIRASSGLTVPVGGELSLPRWPLFLCLALVVVALALVHTATLHLPLWGRLAGLSVVVLALLDLGASTLTTDSGSARRVTWVAVGLTSLLTLVRGRGRFAWWEFPLALAVIGAAFGLTVREVSAGSLPLGVDLVPLLTTQTFQMVGLLALPAALVAGVAFAQLTVSLSHRVGEVVPTGGHWLTSVVLVLAVVRLALTVRHVGSPGDTGYAWGQEVSASAVLLAVVLGVALVVLGIRAPSPPALTTLDDTLRRLAVPVAVVLTVTAVPQSLVVTLARVLTVYQGRPSPLTPVGDLLLSGPVVAGTRVTAAALLVAYALWQRRRAPAVALLTGLVGIVVLSYSVRRLTSGAVVLPWTTDALGDVVSTLGLALLGAFALRRTLTPTRLRALGVLLGLSLAYGVRWSVAQPLTALLGVSGIVVVLLGLTWVMLTAGAEVTRGTARFPTPARVMLFLGSGVVTVASLAFVALDRRSPLGIDLVALAEIGDAYLGTALLLAASVVLAWSCFVDPQPDPAT